MLSLFQENEGNVEDLEGQEVVDVKIVKPAESAENACDILWLKLRGRRDWVRIFLDPHACNVQVHPGKNPGMDLEGNYIDGQYFPRDSQIHDRSAIFAGLVIQEAYVVPMDDGKELMRLNLAFSNESKATLHLYDNPTTYWSEFNIEARNIAVEAIAGEECEDVDLDDIAVSNQHRSTLTAAQEDRVWEIADSLAEVYPKTFDEWVHGFCCDASPEREIRVWEAMAKAYSLFVEGKDLSMEAKEEVLGLALSKSFGRSHEEIMVKPTKYLNRKDKLEFLSHWMR